MWLVKSEQEVPSLLFLSVQGWYMEWDELFTIKRGANLLLLVEDHHGIIVSNQQWEKYFVLLPAQALQVHLLDNIYTFGLQVLPLLVCVNSVDYLQDGQPHPAVCAESLHIVIYPLSTFVSLMQLYWSVNGVHLSNWSKQKSKTNYSHGKTN